MVIKDAGSFEFKVLQYNDTLVFQIPDPDYEDPRDPSFVDLFRNFSAAIEKVLNPHFLILFFTH